MEMPLLAALRAAEAEAAAEEAQADQEEKKKEERKEAGDTSLLALAEGEVAAAAEDAADSTAVAHAEQLRLRRFLSAAGPALARAATTALRQAQRDAERKGLEARVARLAGEVQRATAEVERLRARAEAAEHRLAAAFERENEPPAAATDASGAASPGLVSSHAVQADSPTADISAGLPPPALSEQGPEAVVTALFARRAHWRLPENADMRTMLGRALEQLSHGMYSQRGQVLSELLQNADDNRYAEGVVPTVVLLADNAGLWLANNEMGFNAADVSALCDLGQSAKIGRPGRIGRKGIGFKSVFMLSLQPHVVSNGFAFRFDMVAHGTVGAVLPEWLSPAQRPAPPASLLARAPWIAAGKGTLLYLPWRSPALCAQCQSVLRAMPTHTLLFLQRIASVTVLDGRSSGGVRVLKRHSLPAPEAALPNLSVTELEECETLAVTTAASDDTQRHRVSRFHVWSSVLPLLAGREDYRSRTLQLAFPLQEDGSGGTAHGLDRSTTDPAVSSHTTDMDITSNTVVSASLAAQVYAFLPVLHAGLPFAVQADFDLVASRQELDHDSVWNRHVRTHVAAAATRALEADGILHGDLARFVPSVGVHVHDFWVPVAAALRQHLQAAPCLLGTDGRRHVPADIVLAPHELRDQPAPFDSLLSAHCGRVFAAPADIAAAAALGCRPLVPALLLAALAASVDWASGALADWPCLARLYTFLERHPDTATLEAMLDAPLVRVTTGTQPPQMVTPTTPHIFLSVPDELRVAVTVGALWCVSDAEAQSAPLLHQLELRPATTDDAVQAILHQHATCQVPTMAAVWLGLKLMAREVDAVRSLGPDRLAVLLCPNGAGQLVSVAELASSSFLGVVCPLCLHHQGTAEQRYTMIDLVIEPREDVLNVQSAFSCEQLWHHVSTPPGTRAIPDQWRSARTRQSFSRGVVQFDVIIHSATNCHVGLAAAAAGEEPLGRTKFSVGLSDTGIVTCGATSFNLRPHMWFGAGCAVSIVCDVDRDLIYFAINGQLISNEFVPRRFRPVRNYHSIASDFGISLKRISGAALVGVELHPNVRLCGEGSVQMQFFDTLLLRPAAPGTWPAPLALGRHLLATRRETLARSCALLPPPYVGLTPLHLESLLLTCGARSHMDVCRHRHWWILKGQGSLLECAICQERIADSDPAARCEDASTSVTLPCMHRFHRSCVSTWLHNSHNTCPLCRSPVPINALSRAPEDDGVDLSGAFLTVLAEAARVDTRQGQDGEGTLQDASGTDRKHTHDAKASVASASGDSTLLALLDLYTQDPQSADVLGSLPVPTTRGVVSLSSTYLAHAVEAYEPSLLPVLAIPGDFTRPRVVQLLNRLGVATAPGLETLLRVLDTLAETTTEAPPRELEAPAYFAAYYSTYSRLARYWVVERLRRAFAVNEYLFVPAVGARQLSAVAWRGDKQQAKAVGKHLLAPHYARLEHFFLSDLGIDDISVDDFMKALDALAKVKSPVDKAMVLLEALERHGGFTAEYASKGKGLWLPTRAGLYHHAAPATPATLRDTLRLPMDDPGSTVPLLVFEHLPGLLHELTQGAEVPLQCLTTGAGDSLTVTGIDSGPVEALSLAEVGTFVALLAELISPVVLQPRLWRGIRAARITAPFRTNAELKLQWGVSFGGKIEGDSQVSAQVGLSTREYDLLVLSADCDREQALCEAAAAVALLRLPEEVDDPLRSSLTRRQSLSSAVVDPNVRGTCLGNLVLRARRALAYHDENAPAEREGDTAGPVDAASSFAGLAGAGEGDFDASHPVPHSGPGLGQQRPIRGVADDAHAAAGSVASYCPQCGQTLALMGPEVASPHLRTLGWE